MRKEELRPAWVEIDLDALDNNLKVNLAQMRPGCRMCAVIKANAYGHGMKACYGVMKENGIDCYGVVTLSEAYELRGYGDPDDRIVCFGVMPELYIPEVCDLRLVTMAAGEDYARALSAEAVRRGLVCEVFAAIDTGLGRLGFQAEDPMTADAVERIAKLPGLKLLGLFSHLSSAGNEAERDFTLTQIRRFEDLRKALEARGVALPVNSLTNGPGLFAFPESHYELARPGGSLYGMTMNPTKPIRGLIPVMSIKANISFVKTVPAGCSISYNRSAITTRETVVATVPVGYADGFNRLWASCGGHALVHGRKAPILGVMNMDQFMIDVTDIPGVLPGDEVVALGAQGGERITAEDIGAATHDSPLNVAIGMELRLPYRYLRGGKVVEP